MKKILITAAIFCLSESKLLAQQNCSNPLPVTLCPSTYLAGQTNAGMLNDCPAGCNIAGEDLVYRIAANIATQRIYVSFTGVTNTMRMILQSGSCGAAACSFFNVYSGSSNFTLNVSGNTVYYLWIDASTTVTYNIGIGGDTSNVVINIPNTQGNLGFDVSGCATPMFKATKPYFQVKYNGIYKTDPMTLAPLGVTGSLCVVIFFKNTTGIEGIKKFEFYYNPLGYSSFTPNPASVPGFYNAGTWVSSSGLNKWTFTFNDLLGLGQGDFTGVPNTCLRYEFCFDVVPISNDPVKTNIKDSARSDGFGAPFSGTVRSGCCPVNFGSCLGASGGSPGSSGHSFGFGFADPGALLPIVLLQFDARINRNNVDVNWTTASELNNDFFTVEKSMDGNEWTTAGIIDGAGNSTIARTYFYSDRNPFPGISYYRLKQTDFDGKTSYSSTVSVNMHDVNDIVVFPNPSSGLVTIAGVDPLILQGESENDFSVYVYNALGEKLTVPILTGSDEMHADLSRLPKGFYMIVIDQNGSRIHRQVILQN